MLPATPYIEGLGRAWTVPPAVDITWFPKRASPRNEVDTPELLALSQRQASKGLGDGDTGAGQNVRPANDLRGVQTTRVSPRL